MACRTLKAGNLGNLQFARYRPGSQYKKGRILLAWYWMTSQIYGQHVFSFAHDILRGSNLNLVSRRHFHSHETCSTLIRESIICSVCNQVEMHNMKRHMFWCFADSDGCFLVWDIFSSLCTRTNEWQTLSWKRNAFQSNRGRQTSSDSRELVDTIWHFTLPGNFSPPVRWDLNFNAAW
jgi:hypothetical protein